MQRVSNCSSLSSGTGIDRNLDDKSFYKAARSPEISEPGEIVKPTVIVVIQHHYNAIDCTTLHAVIQSECCGTVMSIGNLP